MAIAGKLPSRLRNNTLSTSVCVTRVSPPTVRVDGVAEIG